MSLYDVKMALQRNYYIPTQVLSYPICRENTDFDPTSGTAYAALTFVPNEPAIYTNTLDLVTGIYNIELFYPSNTGDTQACTDFETLRTRYRVGTQLSYNSQVVEVMSCSRTEGSIVNTAWFRVLVRVNFRAQISR